MNRSDHKLHAARAALKRYDFRQAIALLDAHLALNPDDMEAALERGLAYLMAGDEARFLQVHEEVEPRLRTWPPLGGRLRRLWMAYRGVMGKLARAAAIVALSAVPLTLAGCPKDAETTPPDRHPPARTADASPGSQGDVDAGSPSAPDAGLDAGAGATAPRPRPDASTGATPRQPMNVIRPKYGVRLRYRVVRPHYRYGIRKPRRP